MKSITVPVTAATARCQSVRAMKQQRRLNAESMASSIHRHALPFIALTACALLLLPGQILAQTAEAKTDTATSIDKMQTASVMLVNDVPVGQPVTVTRALFDLGGYQIITQSGSTIAVPFADHNFNVLRFGRSTDEQTYFVKEKEGEAPALYISPNFSLENTANPTARWVPLPPDYNYPPSYVSMVPSYSSYAAMNWYPGMTWYGGVGGTSPNRNVWTLIPQSAVKIDSKYYVPNTYLGFAAGSTSFRSSSGFNYYFSPSVPVGGTTPPGSNGRSMPLQANSRNAGAAHPQQLQPSGHSAGTAHPQQVQTNGRNAGAAHPQQAPLQGSGPNNVHPTNQRPGIPAPASPSRSTGKSKGPHK